MYTKFMAGLCLRQWVGETHGPLYAWAAGFFAPESTGERGGEGTPRPCDFSLGVQGVCLTKNSILCYGLQNYYFLICYACESIEKIFVIMIFFKKKRSPEKNKLLNLFLILLDKKTTGDYI